MKIEFVSDVACPWCAVGLNSLERALERLPDLDVDLSFEPFELNPALPPEGEDAAEHLMRKYGMPREQLERGRATLRERGKSVGFTFGERSRVWNTFDAHRLLTWAAATPGLQRRLKHALLAAYHSRGENPGDPDVLLAAVREAGGDVEAARAVLGGDAHAAAVREREAHWQRLGIHAVPSVVVDGRHLIQGGQPPEVFEQALRQLSSQAVADVEAMATTGLVLTGGGARAAYQVGVLKALVQIRRECGQGGGDNPFPVITGTSAGAINAAALACRAGDFDAGVAEIAEVWENFHAEQVYRSDSIGVIRSGARWLTMMSIGWVIARWRRARPRSLLDNRPLETLLGQLVVPERIHAAMAAGHLQALAVCASSYGSGLHVTFYDAVNDIVPWTRSQRIAVRCPVGIPHLLASSAIPFVFPAVALPIEDRREYFGDGSMRQAAPISPAVHLGAERILIVGAGRMHEPPGPRVGASDYPNLAQIAGHALSNIFLDALAVDVERLQRINATLKLLPPEAAARTTLRPIDVLVIAPSQRLDDLAAKHLGSLPVPIRAMLRGIGVQGRGDDARGAALASYLLFEKPYTRELVALGSSDTLARRDEVVAFFGW